MSDKERIRALDMAEMSYQALNELPVGVFWFDKDARFIEVNETACREWGYTREELLQMSIFDVNPNMNDQNWAAHWEEKQVNSATFESSHQRKGGEEFPVDITDIFIESDDQVYSCAIVRDITLRKQRHRQALLADFSMQKASDVIFWLDASGNILNANDAASSRYEYSLADFRALNMLDISKDLTENDFQLLLGDIKRTGKLFFEETHFSKSGKKYLVETNAHLVLFEDAECFCCIVRDITERKHKEAALRGALTEIRELKEKLEAENNYLQEEIELEINFGEIVSQSASFKKVLEQIEMVADTDSTVLVTGESGTGKELIARALHQLSKRGKRPMIKVNCAALPANLIESELFGHAKGAFTGALMEKIGKFELADGGTLFLDEIGELPIELQPKLLRAIQEGEVEMLGSSKTKQVDVRLIAATNRNLPKEVEDGNFREDLFYRLNVFPIHSVPLRERSEDIPLLARFFCEKIGNKLGRKITDIPNKVIDRLLAYDYPGNVRELENLIERAIITSKSGKLTLGDWFKPKKRTTKKDDFLTLEEQQKQHIITVLKATSWRVSGPAGAAKILNVRPTTLYSKMEKLGIKRSNDIAN